MDKGLNTYFLKKELRTAIRAQRAGTAPEERARMSARILQRLISLPEYRGTGTLLTYVSLPQEVDTMPLIEAALNDGKRVAVPRCLPGRPLIDFYYIRGAQDLYPGSYGLMEPQPLPENFCPPRAGFCVVPGLAFDRRGMRLGYGSGYYDRFLQRFTGTAAGVCFSNILTAKPLPAGRYDLPVPIVVTDREIIRPARREKKEGGHA